MALNEFDCENSHHGNGSDTNKNTNTNDSLDRRVQIKRQQRQPPQQEREEREDDYEKEEGDEFPAVTPVLESQSESESQLHSPRSAPVAISNVPSLICAFAASATTGGTSYAFGFYAAALKHNLHLTQSQLNSISTAFFVAGMFSWIPGLFSDRFGTKFALSLGGCTGAASLLLYWAVAREALFVPREFLVFVLSSLGVITFLSCASVTGAVFKIIVSATGPGTKGSAVGVAKGYVGLGAGLYSCIFQSFRYPGESDLDFLPMAAFFFITCATIPALILLPSKQSLETTTGTGTSIYQDDCTGRHIHTLYGSLISMAVVIIGSSMLSLYETETPHNGAVGATLGDDLTEFIVNDIANNAKEQAPSNYAMGFLLAAIWLGPIAVLQFLPRKRIPVPPVDGAMAIPNEDVDEINGSTGSNVALEEDRSVRRRRSGGRQDDCKVSKSANAEVPSIQGTKLLSKSTMPEEKRGLLARSEMPEFAEEGLPREAIDDADDSILVRLNDTEFDPGMNMVQMLQTPTAWLMLWTTTILVGAGTVETNNMGQMVESLGFEAQVTSASLAFFSVSQAAARVFTGSLSESALNWKTRSCCIDNGLPRPFFLLAASLVGFVAHVILGFASSETLFVAGSALAGAAFGMVWPLMVLISAEIFGIAGAGQNYMFYDGVSSAAGTLLLTKVVAQQVYEDNTSPDGSDSKTCLGMGCFQATHLIVAALSLSCVVSSVAMMYTSRQVYNRPGHHGA